MRSRSMFMAGGAALAVACLGLSVVTPAYADIAPSGSDIVGVGSDTVQNIANFMADGDPGANSFGVNSSVSKNRMFTFDATPDANDRSGYLNGSTATAQLPLTPTIVLRAGTSPIQRPNGSGSGVAALLADKTAPYKINFVRMSRLPKVAEQNQAVTNGFVGGLHVVKLSTDNLQMAAATVTNAPASLTIAQLVQIYECNTTNWSTVGGGSGTIIPVMPQTGSGTYGSFTADLQAGNGGTAVPLGTCVVYGEEHDPSGITKSSSPINTVEPFSQGRLNLYNGSTSEPAYFYDPTVVFPGAATPINAGVKLLGGYVDNRGLYIAFRDADKSSAVKWQPGSSQNWVQALFLGTGNYAAGSDAAGAIASGGATPAYADCGAGPGVTTC
jgi:ABC-type phosphate transport system substrate-binding protein